MYISESNGDTSLESVNIVKPTEALNLAYSVQEHDASPKPLSRCKEKRINRCAPVRRPLTDHINRYHLMYIVLEILVKFLSY